MTAGPHEDPAGGGGRIGRLASIRNRALEPLWLSSEVRDTLSDPSLLLDAIPAVPYHMAMMPLTSHQLAQRQRADSAGIAGAAN